MTLETEPSPSLLTFPWKITAFLQLGIWDPIVFDFNVEHAILANLIRLNGFPSCYELHGFNTLLDARVASLVKGSLNTCVSQSTNSGAYLGMGPFIGKRKLSTKVSPKQNP